MIYLSVILACFLIILIMQKLLPAKCKNKINLIFLALLMVLLYNLLRNYYRIERIINDLSNLIG